MLSAECLSDGDKQSDKSMQEMMHPDQTAPKLHNVIIMYLQTHKLSVSLSQRNIEMDREESRRVSRVVMTHFPKLDLARITAAALVKACVVNHSAPVNVTSCDL